MHAIGQTTTTYIAGNKDIIYPVVTLASAAKSEVNVSLADNTRPQNSLVRVCIDRVSHFDPRYVACFLARALNSLGASTRANGANHRG